MTIEIVAFFSQAMEAIGKVLNANFTIAFVGGLTGAIGGALGAQHIVERSQKRKEGLKELRYTNAAIMVAFSICNTALALKKQHVQPRREAHLKLKEEFEVFMAKRDSKEALTNPELHLQIDMSTYPTPIVPIETLKHMVFRELSVVGRPLALVAVIEQSLIGLTAAITKQDNLIQNFKNGTIPENERLHFYFGLPRPGGHVNQEFPDLVEAIYNYVDDLAFFCSQLCLDLMKHGTKVQDTLGKTSSKLVVSEVDFSPPEKSGLMPPSSQYKDWLEAFVESPQK